MDTSLIEQLRAAWEREAKKEFKEMFNRVLFIAQTPKEARMQEEFFITGYVAGKVRFMEDIVKHGSNNVSTKIDNNETSGTSDTPCK